MKATEVCPSIAAERMLFSIPVIHTFADMGELGGSLEKAKISAFGREKVTRGANLVDKVWDEIECTIETLPLPAGKVRLYQDGLPVCGIEDKIVSELAEAGSRNHKLLLRLQAKGASLMGTERPELLIEEYNHVVGGLNPNRAEKRVRQIAAAGHSLLERRDRYIASRINQTLSPGETGILFIGMLHAVERYLDPDIRVAHPVRLQSR
jgi:hypothetical protein